MKILIVVARYGPDVAGATEAHARAAAGVLGESHEVAVATTTAVNPQRLTRYPPGTAEDEAIRVHRFAIARLDAAGDVSHAPDLLEFLHRDARSYDALLFYDHRAATTVHGLPIAPERAAFVPACGADARLDDRAAVALFRMPRAIGFLSDDERARVNGEFHIEDIPFEILPPAPLDRAVPDARFVQPLERLLALAAA